MRELGEIIAIDGNQLMVRTQLKHGCSGCSQRSTCGAGLLSKAFPQRRGEFRVAAEGHFDVGDQVEIHLPDNALSGLALAMYLLPLIALITGALLGGWLFPAHELGAIGLGFSAFGLSFVVLRRILWHRRANVQQLLSVTPAQCEGKIKQPE